MSFLNTGVSCFFGYGDQNVVACIYLGRIKEQDVEDCATSAHGRYLPYGPQIPYRDCSDKCPGSGVGIRVPEPRKYVFSYDYQAFCYVSLFISNSLKWGVLVAKPPA